MQKSFWPPVFAILVGTFMAVLDTSIVNVAVPKMMSVFNVSADEVQWVVTGYTLVMAAVIPLTGYLGDRFGLKKIYLISFVLFTVGSLFCGLAWSNNSMIAARVIQALGGGLIMPVGQAMLYHVVPRNKIGPAMGVFGISVMVAPAIGPTLSGYIIEYIDWRFIFTINVPIGIIGILMASTFLKETEIHKEMRKFDLLGFIYSTTMLTSLLLAVTDGEKYGWTSFYIVVLFSITIISFLLLIYRELTIDYPLLDLRLFKIPTFSIGVVVSSCLTIGMFGVVYLIPIYSENLLGLSAMKTGIMMFPQSVVSGIITLIAGSILMNRFGAKPLIIIGLVFTAINGMFMAGIDLNTSSHHIQFLLALRGIGLGLCMMTAMQLPLQVIEKSRTGNASAVLNITRQVAMSLGVAVLTSVFRTNSILHSVHLAESVTNKDPATNQFITQFQNYFIANGSSLGEAQGLVLGQLSGLVQKLGTMRGIQDALWVATIFIIVCIPLAIFLKEKKLDEENSEETHTVVEM